MLSAVHILCPWAMVSIRRLFQLPTPPLPFLRFSPGLFVVLQGIPTLLTFICSDQIIAKNKNNKKIILFSTCCSLVLILLFCKYAFLRGLLQLCHQETTNSFIFAYMHSFLFGLSSNNIAQKNSWPWFKNYRLLLFLQFPRKLRSWLILTP